LKSTFTLLLAKEFVVLEREQQELVQFEKGAGLLRTKFFKIGAGQEVEL